MIRDISGLPIAVRLLPLLAGVALAGCSTIPASGPTAAQIKSDLVRHNLTEFSIVDIDPTVVAQVGAARPEDSSLAGLAAEGRTDTLGIGDALSVDIYELGVTLFRSNGSQSTFSPAATNTRLDVVVGADGNIQLPYIGRIQVLGRTANEVEQLVEQAMIGFSQRPQVLVTVRQNAFNIVYVSGDVRAPGKFEIGLPRLRLLDAIARAGGTASDTDDVVVRLTRNGQTLETRLSQIESSGPQNLLLLPGDRIDLLKRPRTFLVFGAAGKVSQVSFGTSQLSLAEAMARVGGPSESSADPKAVFLFRLTETPGAAAPPKPTIYRLNMMRADAYFMSQQFQMQDKDVIYVAGAASNQPGKLVTIISQFFTPIATARALTRR